MILTRTSRVKSRRCAGTLKPYLFNSRPENPGREQNAQQIGVNRPATSILNARFIVWRQTPARYNWPLIRVRQKVNSSSDRPTRALPRPVSLLLSPSPSHRSLLASLSCSPSSSASCKISSLSSHFSASLLHLRPLVIVSRARALNVPLVSGQSYIDYNISNDISILSERFHYGMQLECRKYQKGTLPSAKI